jgi:hypothetical protein
MDTYSQSDNWDVYGEQTTFTAMAGHCQECNDEYVIKIIAAKVRK